MYLRKKTPLFFTVIPKIYVFNVSGIQINEVDIPLQHFRAENPESASSREEVYNTLESHSLISDVFWFNRDTLLVQYYDIEEMSRDGGLLSWRLAAVNLEGELIFEWVDTPRLFGLRNGKAYFQDMNSDVPNQLRVAQMDNCFTRQ